MTNAFDTVNIEIGEPDTLIAGNLTRWRRTDLSNIYDPTDYTLTYSARLGAATATEIEITATSDATGFYTDVPSATSATWPVGDYEWQAYITRNADSERIAVDHGRFKVLADLATSTADPRTHAQRMVTLLESALENRAGSDIVYYMIGGRAVSKIPPKELRELLQSYRAELAGEVAEDRRRRGRANQNEILVRFAD